MGEELPFDGAAEFLRKGTRQGDRFVVVTEFKMDTESFRIRLMECCKCLLHVLRPSFIRSRYTNRDAHGGSVADHPSERLSELRSTDSTRGSCGERVLPLLKPDPE